MMATGAAIELAQVAGIASAGEAGKQAATKIAEAAVKVGEVAISHTITAKRAVDITILNESDLILDKPCWEMKHGHAASEGVPPEKISKSTSEKGVVMRFVKPRVSAYGCVGVLLYRYQDTGVENYLAIRFKVPGAGQNKCAIAILSENDWKASKNVRSFDFVTPKLYKYLKKKYFKASNKPENFEEISSKSCKWMEVPDRRKKVVFGCTMSGEDHAAIKVKISTKQ